MRPIKAVLAFVCVSLTSACAGVGGQPAIDANLQRPQYTTDGWPAPISPQSFTSLKTTSLPNEASMYPELGIRLRPRTQDDSRSIMSTEGAGDAGFFVGLLTPANNTTIFARMTAYTTSQFTLTYPPSGKKTPPSIPERMLADVEPGPSCLLAGTAYVNFGPGGYQRNGPGNPLQFVTGPYNAFRVIDLCHLDAHGAPTFFLTPLTSSFVAKYVRIVSGLPFMAVGVGSPSAHAATNPNAVWYAVLYNFTDQAWQIVHSTTGNFGVFQGDVITYPGTRNLPEVCPRLRPIIAQNISALNPQTGFFQDAIGAQYPTVNPGDFGGSRACFTADSTGPASYTFYRIGPRWVLENR